MEKFVNWKTERITIDGLRMISDNGSDITGFAVVPADVDTTAIEIARCKGEDIELILNAYMRLGSRWHDLVALEVVHVSADIDIDIRKLVTGVALWRVLRDDAIRDCIWGMIYDALDAGK